jgi:PBP1b-binding outer membrane lipoprotein LpoB
LHIIQFALLSFLATGIGCTPAHRIQTGGPESITSTSQIDMQDVQDAASGMIQGLLESGVFQDFKTREGRVAILLLRDHASSPVPDFSLTGSITELRNRAGSRRELNLQFEMALTNWWINLQPWSKVVRVTKSGDRPAVGF